MTHCNGAIVSGGEAFLDITYSSCESTLNGRSLFKASASSRANPYSGQGAPVKMTTLGQVHENEPYLMASNRLRSTGSFTVPIKSPGFTPPNCSFFVSSHLSGSASNSRTRSSIEVEPIG